MSEDSNKDFMRAAVGEIDAMIANLGPDRVLEKHGLLTQKQELLEELAKLDNQIPIGIDLEFSGDPVLGSRGIETRFGASALGGYQALVSALSPNDNKLLLVGTLHNSFGFRLLEAANPLFHTELRDAVVTAAQLLESAAADSDEEFVTAIGQQDGEVQEALKSFVGTLRAHGATCRIVAAGREVSLDKRRTEVAAERSGSVSREATEVWVDGEFRGVTLDSRWFDFLPAHGTLIRGKVIKSIAVEILEEWNRRWSRAACRALIRTVTTARLGSASRSHVLVDIDTSSARA